MSVFLPMLVVLLHKGGCYAVGNILVSYVLMIGCGSFALHGAPFWLLTFSRDSTLSDVIILHVHIAPISLTHFCLLPKFSALLAFCKMCFLFTPCSRIV